MVPRKETVIVSFTSFPAGIGTVHYAIRKLMNQTYKLDRIILWLSNSGFEGVDLLVDLAELCQFGLEIRYVQDNIRPHKRRYYIMKEYPNVVIITVDDDCLYETRLVEKLMEVHTMNQNCVCCNMAHKITLKNSKPDLYDNWTGQ